ncbi:HVA22-like protein h [Brassica rapa]|uniref:HVA22-like protein n=1 Tax=Brassica campestris TaxID=3711 RepID=M4DJ09_BRACM|nr:HVA22-like protein h [Brassica rapa]
MIGSFLTRGLVMVFGYAYPAYECYKAVEKNKPEIQQLRFWCQYWILVAALTVFERVGDTFASWVPLYSEAKLAFFIYLWFPKTRGTTYVYDSFFRPYVSKHENEIDRNLVELRTRAGDMAVIYCRKAVCYGQTRVTDILQFVALQSTPKPKPKEKKQTPPEAEEQKQPDLKAASQAGSSPQARPQPKKPQLLTKEPISVKPIIPPRKQLQQQQQQQIETKEAKPSASQTKLTPLPLPSSPSTAPKPNADPAQPSSTTEAEKASETAAALPAIPASAIKRASSSKETIRETIMEETLRVTRGSLRKARSTGTR